MNAMIFDIDGTICPIKKSNEQYEDLIPYSKMVVKIKEFKACGFKIILFSSRNMKTYNNDLELINKYTRPILEKWLEKWDIPYDELILGKPWPGPEGYYIDDRTIRPKELLNISLEKLNEICNEGRLD